MDSIMDSIVELEILILLVIAAISVFITVAVFTHGYSHPDYRDRPPLGKAVMGFRHLGLLARRCMTMAVWNIGFFVVLLFSVLPFIARGGTEMWVAIGLAILAVIGKFLLPFLIIVIIKALAEENRGFTYVDEATAKIIVKGGGFERVLIQWKGHTINNEGDVVLESDDRKEPYHPLGGLRRFGRPIAEVLEVLVYTFRSATLDEAGEVQRRSNEVDYISLADKVYWCEVEGADILRVPLRLELVITAHVKNPRKALFDVADWLQSIVTRTQAEARNAMTQKGYDDWINDPQAIGDAILAKFKEGTPNILEGEFEERYGIVLRDIQVRKIEVTDSDYRETTLQEDKANRQRRAFEIKADLPAVEAGMLAINMLAQSRGVTPEAISTKLAIDGDEEDKELRKEALDLMTKIHHDKLAIDGKSYMEVNIPGGNLESGLASLLAVFQRMPTNV